MIKKTTGTVCFIVDKNKVLLAKIQYPNGEYLWNGIGGVVDSHETPVQAVVREISEEIQLVVCEQDVEEKMVIRIDGLELHIFIAKKWSGNLEIIDPTIKRLKWFEYDKVPYKNMHKNNDKWLPQLLSDTV